MFLIGYLLLNTGISLVCVKYDVLKDLVDAYKFTDVDVMYFTKPASFNQIASM